MTKEDIKKALEICADDCYSCDDCPYDDVINCGNTLKNDVYELIIKQEREIKRLKAEVKQAQIDVLNKLKERIKTAIDTYFNLDGGGYYLAEGAIDDIDGLIEEVENESNSKTNIPRFG